SEYVHARIVVFVDGASLVARSREPLVRFLSGPVRPVGLAPKYSLPIAGLPKKMIPGNGAVVRGVEQVNQVRRAQAVGAVAHRRGVVKLDRRHVVASDVIDTADHASIVREAHYARQEALGDAVGHVHALRRAPFGDQNALVNEDASQLTTSLDRTDGVAEGFPAEGSVVVKLEISRVLDLARDREVDRVFQQLSVDPCLPRRLALPIRAWEHLR